MFLFHCQLIIYKLLQVSYPVTCRWDFLEYRIFASSKREIKARITGNKIMNQNRLDENRHTTIDILYFTTNYKLS